MTHVSWKSLQHAVAVSETGPRPETLAWVRGYILALEDILGDLEQNKPVELPEAAASESHAFLEGWTWNLGHVRDHVSKALTRARATLKTLEEMEDAHLEAVQRDPAPGGLGSASGAPDPEDQGRMSK